MTEPTSDQSSQFFAYATELVRSGRFVASAAVLGLVLGAVAAVVRPAAYTANASFFSQPNDAGRTGLASLAGQFGVALATGAQSSSPDFFARFMVSPMILRRVVQDSVQVEGKPDRRALLDLLGISGATEPLRVERGAKRLRDLVTATVVKPTGVVELSVQTRWPSVSLHIASALLERVNEFNRLTRQTQASEERKFIEARLALAKQELRTAEDSLQGFLVRNRNPTASAELVFQRDRLARELGIRQSVFAALAQSFEEVRIREVRDTPVITVIEAPSLPLTPDPRDTIRVVIYCTLLGAVIGAGWVAGRVVWRRRQVGEDPEADEFFEELGRRLRVFRRPRPSATD